MSSSLVWEPCREEGSSSPLRRSAQAEAVRSGSVRSRVRRPFVGARRPKTTSTPRSPRSTASSSTTTTTRRLTPGDPSDRVRRTTQNQTCDLSEASLLAACGAPGGGAASSRALELGDHQVVDLLADQLDDLVAARAVHRLALPRTPRVPRCTTSGTRHHPHPSRVASTRVDARSRARGRRSSARAGSAPASTRSASSRAAARRPRAPRCAARTRCRPRTPDG
jgi:hypothetical protein